MKKWKKEIVKEIVRRCDSEKIISFQETVNAMGYKHIHAQDCREIMNNVLKLRTDYTAIKLINQHLPEHINQSLFTTLTFVDSTIDFD